MTRSISKIGALVVLGMFVLMLYMPTALADSDSNVPAQGSYSINIDSNNNEDDRIFRVTHDGNPGTELFRIQEDGNVGIGVISPDEKLEIDGNLKFKEGDDRTISVGRIDDGNGDDLTIRAGQAWSIATERYTGGHLYLAGGYGCGGYSAGGPGGSVYVFGGNDGLLGAVPGNVILAHDGTTIGGNVGIGTDSPNERLDINGKLHMRGNIKLNGNWLSNDGGDEGIYVASDGKVGIGTASPQLDLHIWDGNAGTDPSWGGDDIALIENSGNAYLQFFTPDSNVGGIYMSDSSGRAVGGVVYNHDYDKLLFRSNGANNMVLDSSGNVGIGTTSPTGTLDVNGDDIRIRTSQTPSTSTSSGYPGEIAWDSDFIYVCTATDYWERVGIAHW